MSFGYDHIVIGSGSGGSVVAARLSEDSGRSVLLLEAGGHDRSLVVRAPAGYPNQFHGKRDWDYFTESEPGMAGRSIYEPRGKVIGGCTSMNAMLWVRGSANDYDNWGIAGWRWADVQPWFMKIEHHFLRDGDHGVGGPMRVTRLASPDPLSEMFVKAVERSVAPPSEDVGGPNLHGVSIAPTTIYRGRRWSTARGYIDSARNRRNLTILTRARALRVVVEKGRAVAVEFARNGKVERVRARGDIVLAAGAFGTPHLLQLSGVGDASHLRSIGVRVFLDNPAVGANLSEHPLTLMNWELKPGHNGLSDITDMRYLARWLVRRQGKLASNLMEAVAHVKSVPELDDPDFQLLFGPALFWKYGEATHPEPCMSIGQSYWTPKSTGWVRARSSDPYEKPAVQLNLLTERSDMEAMIRGVRLSRAIAATEPLVSVVGAEIIPGPTVQNDEEVEKWIRAHGEHTFHPACTARMGAEGESVLDSRLRVRGVDGLRVADASALPKVIHANTNAPTILIGERCADFIRSGH